MFFAHLAINQITFSIDCKFELLIAPHLLTVHQLNNRINKGKINNDGSETNKSVFTRSLILESVAHGKKLLHAKIILFQSIFFISFMFI